MDKDTDRLLTMLVIVVVAFALGICLLQYCKRPPVPPTNTPRPSSTATFTQLPPTWTVTVVVPSDTPEPPTVTPAYPTAQPTFTRYPTATPEPTRSYCWFNWYANAVVCYPRYQWHPKPEGRFLR